MADLRFYKRTTIPTVWEPHAFYLILNGEYAETYVTDSVGDPKAIGNSEMIATVITNQTLKVSKNNDPNNDDNPIYVRLSDGLDSIGGVNNPLHVIDRMSVVLHSPDQNGANTVLSFDMGSVGDFVMVDVDNLSPTDYIVYRTRAKLDGTDPDASTGFVCRSGQTTYLPFPTTGIVKVFAQTGTVVSIQVGKNA